MGKSPLGLMVENNYMTMVIVIKFQCEPSQYIYSL